MSNLLGVVVVISFYFGCIESKVEGVDSGNDINPNGPNVCQNTQDYWDEDWDSDCLSNGQEGCATNIDTDQDGTPDYKDWDSDDDYIFDSVEIGQEDEYGKCISGTNGDSPRDTDQDGKPDYLDEDSDNDGVLDVYEDRSGDGLLGCCLIECNNPDILWQQENCLLTDDGCGDGQECQNGKCEPQIAFSCSDGETSPVLKDTFSDGKQDSQRGSYICKEATEENPQGLKEIKTYTSQDGDWYVALETSALYSEISINNAKPKEAAATIDEKGSDKLVAGFVFSLNTKESDFYYDFEALLKKIISGIFGTVTVRASGINRVTHDKFDGIQDTILDLVMAQPSNPSHLRSALLAIMLGRPLSDLNPLPYAYGPATKEFVLRMTTVRRFDQDRPYDKDSWRLVVIGAVASKSQYQNPVRSTGYILDDLTNGTNLGRACYSIKDECDVGIVLGPSQIDVIWVVDGTIESEEVRTNIANNASAFFSRILASGMNFRMGITSMVDPQGPNSYALGKFCTGRFLTDSEQPTFNDCIKDALVQPDTKPFGLVSAKQAVLNHLPREKNSSTKIRSNARLIVIVASDTIPQSLNNVIGDNKKQCTLPVYNQKAVDNSIKEYFDFFMGMPNPETQAQFFVIGGICGNTCNADIFHGYKELSQRIYGGIADVCSSDIGSSLQTIIDGNLGGDSPARLEYIPLSSSLAVTFNGIEIERSRVKGFDYRAASNSLVFVNLDLDYRNEIVVSYKRWKYQGCGDI